MTPHQTYLAAVQIAHTAKKMSEALEFRAQVDNYSPESCARCDAQLIVYRAALANVVVAMNLATAKGGA